MTAADLIDAVRDDQQTELSRIGSSKTLYADTRGEMDPDAIRDAAATREAAAESLFEEWAADADGEVAEIFTEAAADAGDRLADTGGDPTDREFGLYDTLAGFETATERLGGLLGWTLVDKKIKGQLTGFFTGQADPQTASTFRSAGGEIEDLRADAAALLDETCEDWDAAERAALDVVEAAYDDYVETLEELGVNPKDVC